MCIRDSYNTIFIPYLRPFLKSLNEPANAQPPGQKTLYPSAFSGSNASTTSLTPTPESRKKPLITALVMNSPLKQSLPIQMMAGGPMHRHPVSDPHGRLSVPPPNMGPAMTPFTSKIYAFGESPRKDLTSVNNRLNSRKTLSFDGETSDAPKAPMGILTKITTQPVNSQVEGPSSLPRPASGVGVKARKLFETPMSGGVPAFPSLAAKFDRTISAEGSSANPTNNSASQREGDLISLSQSSEKTENTQIESEGAERLSSFGGSQPLSRTLTATSILMDINTGDTPPSSQLGVSLFRPLSSQGPRFPRLSSFGPEASSQSESSNNLVDVGRINSDQTIFPEDMAASPVSAQKLGKERPAEKSTPDFKKQNINFLPIFQGGSTDKTRAFPSQGFEDAERVSAFSCFLYYRPLSLSLWHILIQSDTVFQIMMEIQPGTNFRWNTFSERTNKKEFITCVNIVLVMSILALCFSIVSKNAVQICIRQSCCLAFVLFG
eukprot:TRINITY_DN958_c0_g1_i11.p1 TRINITY_DN958_c0_g1~~TRINITY_DN958_c0_g1_i11.p1  ORF type:complete len:512 (+),score=22.02 TRINITY_DN958_c0_g1_i11:63-1538(+)